MILLTGILWINSFSLSDICIFIILEREGEYKLGGRKGRILRERERETLKEVPHSVRSTMWGLISWPWDHDLRQNQELGSLTNWATQILLTKWYFENLPMCIQCLEDGKFLMCLVVLSFHFYINFDLTYLFPYIFTSNQLFLYLQDLICKHKFNC